MEQNVEGQRQVFTTNVAGTTGHLCMQKNRSRHRPDVLRQNEVNFCQRLSAKCKTIELIEDMQENLGDPVCIWSLPKDTHLKGAQCIKEIISWPSLKSKTTVS